MRCPMRRSNTSILVALGLGLAAGCISCDKAEKKKSDTTTEDDSADDSSGEDDGANDDGSDTSTTHTATFTSSKKLSGDYKMLTWSPGAFTPKGLLLHFH